MFLLARILMIQQGIQIAMKDLAEKKSILIVYRNGIYDGLEYLRMIRRK